MSVILGGGHNRKPGMLCHDRGLRLSPTQVTFNDGLLVHVDLIK